MSVSIALLVQECFEAFKQLVEDPPCGERARDELGRLRVWAGNISAHTTGRRSLEYRLRDSSELYSTVVKYLNELIKVLRSGSPQTASHALNDAYSNEAELYDHDDDDLFADEEFGFRSQDPSSSLLEEANEIITCLLRISMSLRNPARNDQIRYAENIGTKHFEPHDIEHVRMKFPNTADTIAVRLGKATSRHRQYFKYRQEHHSKLAEGLDSDETETVHKLPSTVATSLQQHKPIERRNFESDTESVYTATSYAPSLSGDSHLRPPPRPDVAAHEPFQCPLCFYIITAPDERSWRQHVYEDLPPYICVEPDCKAVSRQFSRRREWRHHMKQHDQQWMCPYKCSDVQTSLEDFEQHLRSMHSATMSDETIILLKESCATATTKCNLHCPLCKKLTPTQNAFYKHVGHHLEQLALFAMPQHLLGEESDVGSAMDESENDEDEQDGGPSKDEALVYLDQVKEHFAHDPDVYQGLLDALADFRSGAADTPITIGKVARLLASAPKLIEGFNIFLPPGYAMQSGPHDSVRVTNPEGTEGTVISNTTDPSGGVCPHWYIGQPAYCEFCIDVLQAPVQYGLYGSEENSTLQRYLQDERVKDQQRQDLRRLQELDRRTDHIQDGFSDTAKVLDFWRRQASPSHYGPEFKPRYCYCDRESYGEMVACDNVNCPQKWFHLECAELKQAPSEEEKWYCRNCRPRSREELEDAGALDGQITHELDHDYVHDQEFDSRGRQPGPSPDNNPHNSAAGTASGSNYRSRSQDHGPAPAINIHDRVGRGNSPLQHPKTQEQHPKEELAETALGQPGWRWHPQYQQHCYYDQINQILHLRDGRSFPVQRQQKSTSSISSVDTSQSGPTITITSPAPPEAYSDPQRELEQLDGGLDTDMRQRLKLLGYTDQTIEVMIEHEKNKMAGLSTEAPGPSKKESLDNIYRPRPAPVYPKVHKSYLDVETLKYYDLPWEYDKADSDYIIILRDMNNRETDVLFEHTARLRTGDPVLINSNAAWVHTDISHYARQRDVIDYMERQYPTMYDKASKRRIQNYSVVTLPEGHHRVWAATYIPQEDVRLLEDRSNSDSKANDD